jgi:Big-like domain-containing protein/VCBS repeat protein/FG-GAP repeat protein
MYRKKLQCNKKTQNFAIFLAALANQDGPAEVKVFSRPARDLAGRSVNGGRIAKLLRDLLFLIAKETPAPGIMAPAVVLDPLCPNHREVDPMAWLRPSSSPARRAFPGKYRPRCEVLEDRDLLSGTMTTLTSSAPVTKQSLPVTFKAKVVGTDAASTPAPAGMVTFSDGTTTLGTVPVVNGTASFTAASFIHGRHSITAQYSGVTQNGMTFDPSTSAPFNEVVRNEAYFAVGESNGKVSLRHTTNGSQVVEFAPFGASYTGPVTAAMGDVNGDGLDDLVVGAATGNPDVKVYNGAAFIENTFKASNPDASLLAHFFAYGVNFNIGTNVAVADVNGDGYGDIITAPTAGNPEVHVYSGKDIATKTFNPTGASLLAHWFAYGLNFNIGANVGAGDVNGDGYADIITGPTAGNPDVRVYNGKDIATHTFDPVKSQLAQVFAFGLNFNVGASVAAGDTTGDGFADVIVGSSVGNPDVKVYRGSAIAHGTFRSTDPSSLLTEFFAFSVGSNIGVTVGASDFESDGREDILTGSTGGAPTYRVIKGTATGVKPPALFEGSLPNVQNGLFVGA